MNSLNKKDSLERGLIEAYLCQLPERVLQFGTGVLLRGLPDYLIDKANKQGLFGGRVVVVKTTSSDASDFAKQDCLYTLNEKGIDKGVVVNQTTLITALSRLVNASEDWSDILALAERPEMDIIISNTTEAGIQYLAEDIFQNPPKSFPAKLTAYLFHRYKTLGEKAEMVVIPTELLVGNGVILRSMVERHAKRLNLPEGFLDWLEKTCRFCNSLVDRIVPGATPAMERAEREQVLGYTDNLMIDSEPFLLWAIEGDDYVKSKLRFAEADSRVVISPDISRFREQKLRLLNGGHTIAVPLAFLSGLKTVGEMMQDAKMSRFTEGVLLTEILPTLDFEAADFAEAVLNRFRNPFVAHELSRILVECTTKMNARNSETFLRYYQKKGELPPLMTVGFAAYLLSTKRAAVADVHAGFLQQAWDKTDDMDLASLIDFVERVLSAAELFDGRLKTLPHFIERVAEQMFYLTTKR